MIQGGGVQTVQIVRQATTTQNQIKLIWLYNIRINEITMAVWVQS
ncbi:hypothetical protein [Candidatus Regiella insecticola]|nr:hypothetical protein [Candidatus Regiella insecticola]